jgi:hypothetical protein
MGEGQDRSRRQRETSKYRSPLCKALSCLPSTEEPTFCVSLGAVRSSSSSEGLTRAQGLSSEASLESNEVGSPSLPWCGGVGECLMCVCAVLGRPLRPKFGSRCCRGSHCYVAGGRFTQGFKSHPSQEGNGTGPHGQGRRGAKSRVRVMSTEFLPEHTSLPAGFRSHSQKLCSQTNQKLHEDQESLQQQ